jgi:hypothetical protein
MSVRGIMEEGWLQRDTKKGKKRKKTRKSRTVLGNSFIKLSDLWLTNSC